jgi:four helix bundle protein
LPKAFERGGNQEFIQFLYVAKASCGEVRSQLYVALDQSYVTSKDCEDARTGEGCSQRMTLGNHEEILA